MKKIQVLLVCLLMGAASFVNAQDTYGGLALYTLRDDMASDAKTTLQAVADAGYKYIEAAGYDNGKFYGMTPIEFKKTLKEIGLKPISSHQGTVTMENADAMIADVKAAGFKYFVIPVPPMDLFTFQEEGMVMGMTGGADNLAGILDTLGEKCKKAGLKLLYHNHDFEFKKNENGVVVIDYLLENCNPKFVNFQMDLFWVTKAGANPVAYFKKYPKRFKIWHVKDMNEDGWFAPVGTGSIDFGPIQAQKKLSGMKYYMVEQDKTFTMEPLEAIKVSHEGLKKFGFN
ncbi:sugar phosphate isomerase/epimerase family protein [Zobellia laminariae]|uniref:sugar phosphate isomerase/epimerase family protein n=1 Tax=Zobellia laminariae TaxID=248906 RepID=UPI0012D8DBEB|nr:sugar phosphate isomerase/epimerase [Zobellia laminariae]